MSNDLPSLALSVRIKHVKKTVATGRRRHDLRIGRQPNYVDGDRSELNSVILECPMPAFFKRTCEKRRSLRETTRKMRTDAAVMTSGIITFGRGLQAHVSMLSHEDQDAMHRAIADAVSDHCGSELVGLVVHRDETAIHGHLAMPAVRPDGQPVSKGLVYGDLSRLQDIAMDAAKPWLPMIEPPVRKSTRIERGDDPSKIYNRSVKQLHEDLPREIEQAQARVSEMEDRVSKLVAIEELTEREQKRLTTYRRRLEDRQAALDVAFQAHVETAAEIEAVTADLDARVDQIDISEAHIQQREGTLDAAEARLDDQEAKLDDRADRLDQRETRLAQAERLVANLISDVADRLGVGRQLQTIRDAIRSASKDPVEDAGPPI